MRTVVFVFSLFLFGCVGHAPYVMPDDFVRHDINVGNYTIASWVRDSGDNSPVHIYIEGDGSSFDARGVPTSDPTPRGGTLREMAVRDSAANVVYLARPCQFIMSRACVQADWTHGRFASHMVDVMADAVRYVSDSRPVVLIGYSGGAMISGLIIQANPDIAVREWITIAGVLNHADWTGYFGDVPLFDSMNLDELPHVLQRHFVAEYDKVVPMELSRRWVGAAALTIIPGTTHGNFGEYKLPFNE